MATSPEQRFAALVAPDAAPVPLDLAWSSISAHLRGEDDVEEAVARLDDLAAEVADRSAEGVVYHLVERVGLRGDRSAYHDPRNSLLPSVLERRLGIPLSLTVVAMEVGRRVGVAIEGIGMPGHFLARDAGDPERFFDLFEGADPRTAGDCRALFEALHLGAPWDRRFLDPVDERPILARLLGNLAGAYRRLGDTDGLHRTLRLLLPGASEQEHRELAVVLNAMGRFSAAAEVLEVIGTPDALSSAAKLRARLN